MVAMLLLCSAFSSGQKQVAEIIKKKYGYKIIELPDPLIVYNKFEEQGKFEGKTEVRYYIVLFQLCIYIWGTRKNQLLPI